MFHPSWSDPGLSRRLEHGSPRKTSARLFISSASFGELRKGIVLLSPERRRGELESWIETDLSILFSGRILSVTRSVAERWGAMEGQRQLAGRPLNAPDGMIAATAIEHDLTVVTRNVRDFAGFGVAIFNPWDAA